MKLRDVVKGTRAVKPITFRLANAPPPPPLSAEEAAAGVSSSQDPGLVTVGVRVLTAGEQHIIFARALEDAKSKGVAEWAENNPICRLAQMIRTLELACVDAEKTDEAFFASAAEIESSPEIGVDNLVMLFEEHDQWQDECSFQASKHLSFDQMLQVVIEEAERDDNALSPFSRLRPGMRASCTRFLAKLWWDSAKASLRSSSPDESSGTSSPNDMPSGNA